MDAGTFRMQTCIRKSLFERLKRESFLPKQSERFDLLDFFSPILLPFSVNAKDL